MLRWYRLNQCVFEFLDTAYCTCMHTQKLTQKLFWTRSTQLSECF